MPATVRLPSIEGGGEEPFVLLSRLSGSYLHRGHAFGPCIAEAIVGASEAHSHVTMLNGSRALRLEMNKFLSNIAMCSGDFLRRCGHSSSSIPLRSPGTVLVTKLTEKLVASAVRELGLSEGVPFYVKSITGGGSTSVHRLHNTRQQLRQDRLDAGVRRHLDPLSVPGSLYIVQASTPQREPNVQYRFEVIGRAVYYATRIEYLPDAAMQSESEVRNFCLCDIGEEDADVSLRILHTAGGLAEEAGMLREGEGAGEEGKRARIARAIDLLRCIAQFAEDNHLFVGALEGTLHNGKFYCFDVNTNTNYNERAEAEIGIKPAAHYLLECMLEEVERKR